MKTGADLSHYQSSFNADAYYAAEDFLILKATEHTSYSDPTFRPRWQAAGPRPRAAYHFSRPGRGTVDTQADHFIATVRAAGWADWDAWALDFEDAGGLGPATLVTWAERWIGRVRAALGGRGLFYAYPRFVIEQMGDPGRVPGGCLAWVARYRTDSAYAPLAGLPTGRPKGWPDPPDVHQCTNGTVGCVHDVASVGRCDWNRATDTAFAVLFGGDDMPLSDEEIDRIAARVEARLQPRINAAVSLLYRGDVGEDETHPDNLGQVRKDIATSLTTVLTAVRASGVTVTDVQAELIGTKVATAVVVAGHPDYEITLGGTATPKEPTP